LTFEDAQNMALENGILVAKTSIIKNCTYAKRGEVILLADYVSESLAIEVICEQINLEKLKKNAS